MEFEKKFVDWIDASMQEDIPETAKGYSFNLYEPAGEDGVSFGVELIGAGSFDESDPDWACKEVWEPNERGISIPEEYSGQEWEGCLEKMRDLLIKFLSGNTLSAKKLKSSQGIGLGFVDGDLEVIWMP